MAHILPETLPHVLPSAVIKTFHALKALPDTFYIWHHLAPWQLHAPDFLMITREGQVLVIKVSTAAASQALSTKQLQLLGDCQATIGEVEEEVVSTFIQSLQLPETIRVGTLIIYPNIPHKKVVEYRENRANGKSNWAGRDLIQGDPGLKWEEYFPKTPIGNVWLEKIRQQFTPEVVVPSDFTVRTSHPRRLEAGLTNYLLDYNQEAAVKADLDFEVEGKALSNNFRLNIINGVAGSGKTLILLYRLRLLYHYYPNKRFLVLTHNRPLNHDLQSRFARLNGYLPENIEWCTFNGWCFNHWPKNIGWRQPLSLRKRETIIQQTQQQVLANSMISANMLQSEIDWVKDQTSLSLDQYLLIDRRGRGFGLTSDQRNLMWKAIQAYQLTLTKHNYLDWGDIPQLIWQYIENKSFALPQYDCILVDEAQFFAPLWVRIIQRTLLPNNSHLFVVADPTQGFLGRKMTWKSLGLEARGRSTQLSHSYRTTHEILQFATMFYRQRLPNEKDEDIISPDLFNMPNGVIPQVITISSPQDEIARVANEVAEFVKKGFPKNHLLLLHTNGQQVNNLISAINNRLGKNSALDPKDTYPGDFVRVTTLNAGAGLESPIVFLIGLRDLFEREHSERLSDSDRDDLARDNTRKIYMACTRAGQRLVFTYVGDLPQMLRDLLNPK